MREARLDVAEGADLVMVNVKGNRDGSSEVDYTVNRGSWSWEGDADPDRIRSNEMEVEWPRGSGVVRSYPEVDRCGWFSPDAAREKINAAQAELIDRLLITLGIPAS